MNGPDILQSYRETLAANIGVDGKHAEYCLRVARRILVICCSAVPCGPGFCFIFAPFKGYDERKSLR